LLTSGEVEWIPQAHMGLPCFIEDKPAGKEEKEREEQATLGRAKVRCSVWENCSSPCF
jgi:hypothetical protein